MFNLDVINLVKLLKNRLVVLNRGEKILQGIAVFFTEYEGHLKDRRYA